MSRTAVVGLGLIGGSVALALGSRGYDRLPEVRGEARRRGIDVPDGLPDAVAGAEIVVTAVPTSETPALLRELSALAPAAILTDTASLKLPVVLAARTLRAGARMVAGHPMAGSARGGIAAATPDLFRGRPWILAATARSDETAIEAVSALVRESGARPLLFDAEQHDRLMTWVSHLPVAVASALARVAKSRGGPDTRALAGPGLLDTTRLAGQPPSLALELALADPGALAAAIDEVSAELGRLGAALRRGDAVAVAAFFAAAASARAEIDPHSRG